MCVCVCVCVCMGVFVLKNNMDEQCGKKYTECGSCVCLSAPVAIKLPAAIKPL